MITTNRSSWRRRLVLTLLLIPLLFVIAAQYPDATADGVGAAVRAGANALRWCAHALGEFLQAVAG
ncbi:hypothetical protein Sru01_19610 [Sphaerisporangium rufum]|uniref:Uncharacterized protein n=1 Tax=Sphaerisporangium rufum TaxID=1381558 RepID=A0A919UYN3_9ACTN|nr:hypothetical protein [Sphaerisporangium rufum]GII76979.1 hypothetical protein Sru01_19610 [Sphaerisporangium rufum]